MAKHKKNKGKSKKRKILGAEEFKSESNYYSGPDIKKPFDVEIKDVEKVQFNDGKKWTVQLNGHRKGIVVNKTNGRQLVNDLGDILSWPGQSIHVSTQPTRNPKTNQMGPGIVLCGLDVADDKEEVDDDDLDDDLD